LSSRRWWVLEVAIRHWRMVVRIALAALPLIAGMKPVKLFPQRPLPAQTQRYSPESRS
jgi:hypothetical protein